MKNLKTLSFLALLFVSASLWAQTYNWTEQVITDRSENLQSLAVAEDGSATVLGFGNILMRTTDGSASWQETGLLTSADEFDYQDISISENFGLIVSMTGYKAINRATNDLYANSPILKTNDKGTTWALLSTDGMGDETDTIADINEVGTYQHKFCAAECINDTVAYIAALWKDIDGTTHSTTYKTSDAGTTWKAVTPDRGNTYINSIVEYNGNVYIAGNKTLYKVSVENDALTDLYPIVDEGEDDGMYFWHTTIAGSELIFPSTSDSIHTTSDEGASFQTIPNVKGGNIVYKHDANTILVAKGSTDTKATTDGGATWEVISAGESLWNGGVVGDTLIGLGKQNLFKMAISDIANGSFEWTKHTITDKVKNFKAMEYRHGKTFVVGMGDIVFDSDDDAQTFADVSIPSKSDIIYSSVELDMRGLGQGKGEAGIASTRFYKNADYPSGGPTDVYLPGFIFTTTDNWTSYTVLDDSKIGEKYGTDSTANPYADGCYKQDFYAAECIDDSTFYVSAQWVESLTSSTKHTRLFKTIDSGETWDTISGDYGSGTINGIRFKGDTGYIYGNKIFDQTLDGGTTMTSLYSKITDLGATNPFFYEVSAHDNTVYATTSADGIFVSYDAGDSFSQIDGITGANGFIVITNNSWMTIGGSTKTFFTNDEGANWESCSPGSTMYYSGGIYNDSIIGLGKSKIYKLAVADLDSDVSGINETKTSDSNIRIWQNGPTLNIQSASQLSYILLYDISGQLIVSDKANSNFHSINTSQLSSGIYIVKADNEVKKVLIK